MTKGHCAFCLQSSPGKRTVLFKANVYLWFAYLGTAASFALERFVFTMLVPVLEVCTLAFVLNSLVGIDMEMVVNALLIPMIITRDYNVRKFYENSPPGSTLMNEVLPRLKTKCKEILAFDTRAAMFSVTFLKLYGYLILALQLAVVLVMVVPLSCWTLWKNLGIVAPVVRVLGAISSVYYYTNSMFIAVLFAILADMFTDARFQGKVLPYPEINTNGPLPKKLTDGFLHRIYKKPPPPPTTTTPAVVVEQQPE